VQKAAGLAAAKRSFARDYATVIYLGKSIPSTVDMPSLLVQLDRAARGTGIKFTSIEAGDRTPAGSSPGAAPATSTPPPANGGTGPASSTTPAQSAPGGAAQKAGGAVNQSNGAAAATGATDTTTSTTPGAASTPAPVSNSALDTVPLDFEFDGSFFDLADFFHRMKRFVRVANKNIVVRGRLMTINSFSFDSKDAFPSLTATVHATVYLAPKAEGVTAGASSNGPSAGAPTPPPAGQTASSSSPSTPPAAMVTR
jgi:Tfp pilus assembly protein PilO